MKYTLPEYQAAMQEELEAILSFWMEHTVDTANGGFIGQIDHTNTTIPNAPKGAVLNARILWSFSAAYQVTKNKDYLAFARRAFDYICNYFIDRQYQGVYWTVDHTGQPLDTKKQVYAQAFTLYALCEFYKATNNPDAIIEAIGLFDIINAHGYDKVNGGYTEAFTRNWDVINDLRLSQKDANEKKSMNTNLHVLEAFTTLYQVWPHQTVKDQIGALANIFLQHIIDPVTGHQHLFFDEEWKTKSVAVSYGHDIETAWLLQEAAITIGDTGLIEKTTINAVKMADAVTAGLDNDGGLWYEYEPAAKHLIREKHMWPQAEAMVGFFNAYQNTGRQSYLDISWGAWQFVKQHIHDTKNGEWYWGVKENYIPMAEDKVGIWKCPYHNSRACMEIIKRIDQLHKDK